MLGVFVCTHISKACPNHITHKHDFQKHISHPWVVTYATESIYVLNFNCFRHSFYVQLRLLVVVKLEGKYGILIFFLNAMISLWIHVNKL